MSIPTCRFCSFILIWTTAFQLFYSYTHLTQFSPSYPFHIFLIWPLKIVTWFQYLQIYFWNFIFSPHLLWPLYRDAPSGLLFHHKLRMEPLPAQPLLNLLCLPLPSSFCMFFIFMFYILFILAIPCDLQDWTQVSCIAGGFSTSWVTMEAQEYWTG